MGKGLALTGTALAAGAALAVLLLGRGPDLEELQAQYRRPATIPSPSDNPLTPAKVELGKTLFYDPRLSGGNAVSCASCHNPALGWEDGLATGRGEPGTPLPRHTPTLWNLAWEETFFWDGRAASLEAQAHGPLESPLEMNQPVEELAAELQAIAGYRDMFAAAFPAQPEISPDTIAKALASFQRTLTAPETAFDRWLAGDETALDDSAERGFLLFNGKARCAECHSGWAFTDRAFHDIGLPSEDPGRGPVIGLPEVNHAFKTPTLHDLSRRAPYMHDGSLATLEEVIDLYDSGFIERPTLATEIQPLGLSPSEKSDLIAFLHALDVPAAGPQGTPPELPQ